MCDYRAALELELEGKLDHARIVQRGIYHAKAGTRVYILHAARTAVHEKVRVVPYVEEFRAKVQLHTLAQWEVLDEGHVGVHIARSVQRSPVGVPKFTQRVVHKGTGIEPIRERMELGGRCATRVRGDRPGLVRVAYYVGPVQAVPVPAESYA